MGFEPDPAYPLAPFHPQAVNAFMGHVTWDADRTIQVRIIPVDVEPPGRPTLAPATRAADIYAYVEQITHAAGLRAITISNDGRVEEVTE